jgi:hypothetical protein
VDGDGEPRSAAHLGWTEAIVLLSLAAEDESLPVPPAPEPAETAGGALPVVVGALLCAGVLAFATRRRG